MLTVTKEFSWAMAHRLTCGYKGPCRSIHGHTYKAAVTIRHLDNVLNRYAMIIDFGIIKSKMHGWIDKHLDHAVLLAANDKSLLAFCVAEDQKHFVLPSVYTNTTAEQIAEFLHIVFGEMIHADFEIAKLQIWETETSYATVCGGNQSC